MPLRATGQRTIALVLGWSSIAVLVTVILLACAESAGHVDILAGPINGWTGGVALLLASETLAGILLVFNALTLPHWNARVLLSKIGILCFVVAGATGIAGYAGNGATYATVTTLEPGEYVPYATGSASCHNRVVVAREAGPVWHSHGALYLRQGVFLIQDVKTTYSGPFGSKPIAEGDYTASCGHGGVTVHFTHGSEEPPIPAVTLTFTQ